MHVVSNVVAITQLCLSVKYLITTANKAGRESQYLRQLSRKRVSGERMDTPKPRELRQESAQETRLWLFRKEFHDFLCIGKPTVVGFEIQHAADWVGRTALPHEATTQVDHEEGQVHRIRNGGFFHHHKVLQAPVL